MNNHLRTNDQRETFDLESLKTRNWNLSYIFTFPTENMDKQVDEKLRDANYEWSENSKERKSEIKRVQKLLINLVFQKMRTFGL